VDRVPADVIDVVGALLKRAHGRDGRCRLALSDEARRLGRGRADAGLGPPELDRPVDRAREEEVREVDRADERVKVEAGDRPGVAAVQVVLVEAGLRAGAVVPVGLVDVTLFGADPERRRLVVGKVDRSDRNLVRLRMGWVSEVERLLQACGMRG
jgi:hypothetical protein